MESLPKLSENNLRVVSINEDLISKSKNEGLQKPMNIDETIEIPKVHKTKQELETEISDIKNKILFMKNYNIPAEALYEKGENKSSLENLLQEKQNEVTSIAQTKTNVFKKLRNLFR